MATLWDVRKRLVLAAKRQIKKSSLPAALYMLRQRVTRRGSKRAVFFPDTLGTGSSGDLRVEALAARLKNFGWRVIVVPNWMDMEYRQKVLAREKPHVILLQQSRHPLNRPALYPGYATIYDVDDADYVTFPNVVAECARTASVSVVGNHHLAEIFRGYGARDPEIVWTSTYILSVPGALPNAQRKDVITWAHSHAEKYQVEAGFVQQVLLGIARVRPFIFRMYSNDTAWTNAYVAPLREAGIEVEIFGTRRYESFIQSLSTVAIGLQPVLSESAFSLGKSFGKLLAYMAADVAVVASHEVDHPLFFRNGESGMLPTTLEQWIESCVYLLNHPAGRGAMVAAARRDFLTRLSMDTAAEKMNAIMNRFVP